MPTAVLAALLAAAPELIMADSASRDADPPGRDTRHWTLHWLRGMDRPPARRGAPDLEAARPVKSQVVV